MSRKAGVISIDINAGTAKMVVDLEKGKAALRDFGTSGKSSMAATSVALREFEGNITNNTRGVARFLATTLNLGPVLSAAFPVFGAVAFGGMLFEMGKKVGDFFKEIQQAPEKIGAAFRALNQPLKMTNDELAVTNDRLSNDIAKLEGRRQNTLKLALDEARLAADRLGDSLEKDLVALDKLLKEQNIGMMRQMFGEAGTGDLSELIGGKTGAGGFIGKLDAEIAKGGPGLNNRLKAMYGDMQKTVADMLDKTEALQKQHKAYRPQAGGNIADLNASNIPVPDQTARLELLRKLSANLGLQSNFISLSGTNTQLTAQKESLTAGRADDQERSRLQKEFAAAAMQGVNALEKLDMQYQQEFDDLVRNGQANKDNLTILDQIYDLKRIEAVKSETERLNHEIAEVGTHWTKLNTEVKNSALALFAHEIEEGTKGLERNGNALKKWAEEKIKLDNQAKAQDEGHRLKMLPGGGGPMAMLDARQAVEIEEINKRYNQLQHEALTGLEKINVEKQRSLDLDRLRYEREELAAQLRRQRIDELTGPAESGISGQLADLVTGRKTNFGKMFQDVGHQMAQQGFQKLFHMGTDKLFGVKRKPTGAAGDPVHVVVDNGADGGSTKVPGSELMSRIGGNGLLSSLAGLASTGGSSIGGFFLGALKSLFSKTSVSSSISYPAMAGGGSVDPGQPYWVGDGGEPELFTPRSAGNITPMSKMGGSPVYHIDARGADLGAHNRIARGIEAAHDAAVRNSIRAQHQRAMRTPQRRAG